MVSETQGEDNMATTVELAMETEFSAEDMRELYGDVRISIVRITPAVAERWLEANTNNRPLNKRHVAHMAYVMTAGDMVFNGETIIFDRNGVLLNGQHRLWGCVESGRWFDSVVVRNVSPEAFDTLDGGRKRTVGELLAMGGEQNSSNVAAAVSALVSFVDRGGTVYGTTTNCRVATPQVCERVLESHPGLRESVRQMRSNKLYDNQWAYILHYLFKIVDARLANEFAEVLRSGSADVGRPFNIFREHLIKGQPGANERRKSAAKAIKAWNAERAKERPKMLKLVSKEDFPAIDGLDYEALAETV